MTFEQHDLVNVVEGPDLVDVEEQTLVTLIDGFIPVPGPPGPPGPPGTSVTIKGELDDPSDLPATGVPGDGWLIDGDLWVFTEEATWVNVGSIEGPPGPAGGSFTFVQSTPSVTWVIDHGLGYMPSVTVVDSAGSQVEGDVNYASATQVVLTFSAAFSGTAYLS